MPHDGVFELPSHHTVEQIAQALAMLPPESRALVKQLNLDPKANPEDQSWAKAFHNSAFSSYMTCGAEGTVDVYPTDGELKRPHAVCAHCGYYREDMPVLADSASAEK